MNSFSRNVEHNGKAALNSYYRTSAEICQFLALIVLLTIGQGALYAARVIPEPFLIQMEQGYGVIAAVVEKATELPVSEKEKNVVRVYDVRFRVEEILAQSIVGGPLPARKGSTIDLRLAVGYGSEIENFCVFSTNGSEVLGEGKRYILTVKYNKKNRTYEHARGASAAHGVTSFDPDVRRFYRKIHEIADAPPDGRVKRCRQLLLEATAGSSMEAALRCAVLQWLLNRAEKSRDEGRVGPDRPTKSEVVETRRLLMRVWTNSTANYIIEDLIDLDYYCRAMVPSFDESAERREVWLKHLFAPIPGGAPADIRARVHERVDRGFFLLSDLAKKQPKLVGLYLVKELNSNNWPMLFRIYIAMQLRRLYEFETNVDPLWEGALQTFYEKAIAVADAEGLSSLASAFSTKPHVSRRGKGRGFKARFSLEESLGKALQRMREEERKATATRQFIKETIRKIEEVLQDLKKAKEAK